MISGMQDPESSLDVLIGLSAVGGSVGVILQEFLAPELEGRYYGSVVGALLAFAAWTALNARRSLRAVAQGPEVETSRVVASAPPDRMSEPYLEAIQRPAIHYGIGALCGTWFAKGITSSIDSTLVGVLVGFLMFAIRFAVQIIKRSRSGVTPQSGSVAATKERAKGSHLFTEWLGGACAAVALCSGIGVIVEALVPAAVDAWIIGIPVGVLLHGAWFAVYVRRH